MALAWELAQSPVVIPIPGAKRPQSIRDSAAAADLELTDDGRLARLNPTPAVLWHPPRVSAPAPDTTAPRWTGDLAPRGVCPAVARQGGGMADNARNDGGDWGEHDLDPREREEAELNLDDPSAGDDEPWSPPDRLPRGAEIVGVDTERGRDARPAADAGGARAGTAYGAPDDSAEREAARMVGGDDPDAIPADQDVLGGPAGDDACATATGRRPPRCASSRTTTT